MLWGQLNVSTKPFLPFLCIQEGLGKRVVFYFEGSYLRQNVKTLEKWSGLMLHHWNRMRCAVRKIGHAFYARQFYALSILLIDQWNPLQLFLIKNTALPTSSFWYAVTAMNCVSGKEWLVIVLLGPPTRTMWMRGSYLWREFNMIWTEKRVENSWKMSTSGDSRTLLPSTHLSSSVEFIGEFDFAERDGGFHPVRTEVWGIRVDVHAAGRLGFGFSSRNPLPVHVLPPVVVRRHEVQQNGIHGVRVQAGYVYFEHRKHAPIGGK